MADLVRLNRLAVGRELRMIELKSEVNAMAQRAGLQPRTTWRPLTRGLGAAMKPSDSSASGRAWSRYLAVGLIVCVGVGLSLVASLVASHWEHGKARAYFGRLAGERVAALREALEVEQFALTATRAYYSGSERVERHEFRTFAGTCLPHLRGIQAMAWVPRLPGAERAECEQAAREEGVDGYEIREMDGEGGLVRAPARAEYFPVLFVEPRAGNERALGFNVAWDPKRWEAMERARDSNEAVATGPIVPVREVAGECELLLFLPVYRRGQPCDTVEERRAALEGFVVGVLRPREFLANTVRRLNAAGVDVWLHDLSAPGGAQCLACQTACQWVGPLPSTEALDARKASALHAEHRLRVGKRHWSVVCVATPEFISGVRTWLPWAGLACGLTLTGALAFYLVLQQRHAERLAAAAAQVARANETLETEVIARREATARLEEEVAAHTRAARDVQALQRQIEFVLGATKTGLDMIDGQFNLRYVDPAWAKIYGDWAGRKCHEYFMGLGEPCPGCGIPRALETRSTIVTEETLVRENNRRIQVTTIPFQDESGEWLVAEVNVDITELARRAEELASARKALLNMVDDLESARAAAEAASRAKSEFLANMSHEIRTPMNAILGFAKLLLREPLTADQRGCVETICRSGNDLLTLINDILDLSKIEAKRVQPSPEVVDVAAVARGACNLLEPRAAEKGLRLAVAVDPCTPAAVTTDPVRLRQILVNLVGNAVKFTDSGSVTVTVAPAEPAEGDDECLHFAVADTGIGIPLDRQEAIFEAFVQGDGSTTRKHGGTGLGLTISRRLAELLGGRIWVESSPGQGSTFHFTIRTHLAGAAAAAEASTPRMPPTPAPTPATAPPDADGPFVLVVEDDPTTARLTTAILRKAGYNCAVARDGAAALDTARVRLPLAIVLDLMLPVMDGFDVLRSLKADPVLANVPVIVCSVLPEQSRAFGLGALDYVEKPIDGDLLVRKLDRLRRSFGTGGNVMVVDDDRATRLILQRVLTRAGYRVAVADSGPDCLALVDARAPADLVVLDLLMPGMDGFEVLEALRQREGTRDVPVIINTGHDLSPDDLARLNGRYDAILSKSADDIPGVVARVAALLDAVRDAAEPGPPRAPPPPPRAATILVAEDEPTGRRYVRRVLEERGCRVLLAENGQQAVEAAQGQHVDLVLMDVGMPVLDGLEATRRIRETAGGAHVPIIALTAHAMSGDEAKCRQAGCDAYLAKPVDPDDLLRTVARHLEAAPQPHAARPLGEQGQGSHSPAAPETVEYPCAQR